MTMIQFNTIQFAHFIRGLSDEALAELFCRSLEAGSAPAERPKKPQVKAKPKSRPNGAVKASNVGDSDARRPGRPKQDHRDLLEKVFDFVTEAGEPVSVGELVEELEIERPLASKLLKALVAEGRLHKDGAARGTTYTTDGAGEGDAEEEEEED